MKARADDGLDTIKDLRGKLWRVHERLPTPHGFEVVRGVPKGQVSLRGRQFVLTKGLADYLRSIDHWPQVELPIGRNVLRRMRQELELQYAARRHAWWQAHLRELRRMSTHHFAEKHGLSPLTVRCNRRRLLGVQQVQRGKDWWRAPKVARLLLSAAPQAAADQLGLQVSTVRVYRKRLGSGAIKQKHREALAREAAAVPAIETLDESSKYHTRERYGIYRVASAKTWRVHLHRHGKQIQRHFPDLRHGGAAAGLQAAMKSRDEILRQHPPMAKREFNQIVRSNNSTGVAGVSRNNDPSSPRYTASTQLPDGRQLRAHFTVKRHGESEALALAIAERMRQLEQVDGIFTVTPVLEDELVKTLKR